MSGVVPRPPRTVRSRLATAVTDTTTWWITQRARRSSSGGGGGGRSAAPTCWVGRAAVLPLTGETRATGQGSPGLFRALPWFATRPGASVRCAAEQVGGPAAVLESVRPGDDLEGFLEAGECGVPVQVDPDRRRGLSVTQSHDRRRSCRGTPCATGRCPNGSMSWKSGASNRPAAAERHRRRLGAGSARPVGFDRLPQPSWHE